MDIPHIIMEALEKYDAATEVVERLSQNTYLIINKSENDLERSSFIFMDRQENHVILETEVEILAVYYSKYQLWNWAWAHPALTSSENYLSREILKYALRLGPEMAYIKNILVMSRGIIDSIWQIDINLAICADILKKYYIYQYQVKIGQDILIYYFVLLDDSKIEEFRKNMAYK